MKYKITAAAVTLSFIAGMIHIAQAASVGPAQQYNPQMNSGDFTTNITNPYFSLPIGKKMVYESKTEGGTERVEILIPGWKKTIMGIETLVMWDRVYLNNQLIEDTRDYLAQHTNGDVWYFGENVDSYENGRIKDHSGSWIAGVDGAKPGIWALANPKVGDEFRNEYYANEAEDITKILAVNETVTVPQGTFTGCIKTLEWTPIDPNTENKYYCKQAGATVLEVDLPGPKHKVEVRGELLQTDLQGALGVRLPGVYAKEGIVGPPAKASDDYTDSKSINFKDTPDTDNWLGVAISGLVGLILGIVLQKFVFNRRVSL